jgi:hypothetical protein
VNTPEPLATKCFYREKGVECESGFLFHSPSGEAVLLEGTGVYCPACDGKGMILTNKGRELLAFLEKFGRPFLRDIMDEISEERG